MADGRIFGRRLEQEIQPLSDKKLTYKIAGTGEEQDVLALLAPLFATFVGQLKTPPVEPNCAGVGCITIQQLPNKRQIFDDVTGEDIVVTNEAQIKITAPSGSNVTDYTVVGDSPNAYGFPLEDNGECAGKVNKECILEAGALLVTAPVGTAYEVCLTPYCFAPSLGGETVDLCTTGTGKSIEGLLKYDSNPASISQGTMDNSYIEVTWLEGECAGTTQYPITGELTVEKAENGDPVVVNFANAFNAIGTNFCATDCGLDGAQTNSAMGIQVPTGLGNIVVTIITEGGSNWTLTWDDVTGTWSSINDEGDSLPSGSANTKGG